MSQAVEGTRAPAATPGSERIVAMDALRGVALLGILIVNLPSMALPLERAYASEPSGPTAEALAWVLVNGVCMSKFFALFSMLFGMGLVLQMQRAERTGRDFARSYRRRLAILGAVGLVHGLFLFVGDILFVYSLAGFVLYLCRGWQARTFVRAAVLLLAFGAALSVAGAAWLEPAVEPVAGVVPTWSAGENVGLGELFELDEAGWTALETKAYADGPYATTLLVNATNYATWLLFSTLFSFNWHVLAYFFLGAALMRGGFFRAERARLWCRMAASGLGLGAPLVAWSASDRWVHAAELGSGPAVVLAGELGNVLMAGGYLGACALVFTSGRLPHTTRALAAAGRMALTNYIAQSIAGNLLFRWYGFDLYGALTHAELVAVAAALFTAQVAFSVAWARAFGMGPLEWAWRKLTYAGTARSA